MSKEMWVVLEHHQYRWAEITFEMLAEARPIADRFGQELIAVGLGSMAPIEQPLFSQLAEHGADRVIWLRDPLLGQPSIDAEEEEPARMINSLKLVTGPALEALSILAESQPPSLVIFPATENGKFVAPALAARLGAALITDCLSFNVSDDGSIFAIKPIYRGKVHAKVGVTPCSSVVLTLRPGVVGKGQIQRDRMLTVKVVDVGLDPHRFAIQILRVIPADPKTIDLSQADRIIAVGRGVEGEHGLALVQQLAEALSASVGASRPAVDAGWVDHERLVGQTGQKVSPELYLACGISGATQHLMGMKGSRVIIAINSDRAAPIIEVADLGLVGDLHQIIPHILEQIAKSQEESANAA